MFRFEFQNQSYFSRMFLEAINNNLQNALHDLSDQIKESIHQSIPQPEFVVIRYKNMPNKKEHTDCPICFDDYEDNSMVLSTKCLHFFHEKCLKKWAAQNNSCPICRHNL